MIISRKHKNRERGQILILCALSMVVLLLFVGLAIDFGLAYLTKAKLGKALDAASLAGARNLYQGTAQAEAIARSTFAMNYGSSGRDVNPPVVNVSFVSPAPDGSSQVNVSATSTIGTYFIGLLPQFKTLNVAVASQSNRNRVVMTLVLDRSGSMNGNGGAAAPSHRSGDLCQLLRRYPGPDGAG
jgi:Flp pilus assembly protein TadG